MDREGYDLGQWLADHGIAAFVLKYRLARDQSNPTNTPQPYASAVYAFDDAQRAIRLVRSRAQEWGVDPNRVGVMGFSAGGETAGRLLLGDPNGDPNAADPIDRINARPDFAAHIYSAFLRSLIPGSPSSPARFAMVERIQQKFLIGSAAVLDIQPQFPLALILHNMISDHAKIATLKRMPPTFLLCSATDSPGVVDFTDQFFLALKHAGVPAEVHVFSEGGHGFGVRKWSKSVGIWPELFEGWLNDQGFLKKK
jgi:endo-1,4-beta-xylanase